MPASELQTLLIEDNPGDARLVQEYLADVGTIRVNLTHVERLNDGLVFLKDYNPDAILVDLSLPDSHGLETFIQVRDHAQNIPYCHHEKWDGSGYPRGLERKQIPLPARIFAVVDVYDALTSDRPYRDAWPVEKALAYIREQADQHFDPDVVEMFLEAEHDARP